MGATGNLLKYIGIELDSKLAEYGYEYTSASCHQPQSIFSALLAGEVSCIFQNSYRKSGIQNLVSLSTARNSMPPITRKFSLFRHTFRMLSR